MAAEQIRNEANPEDHRERRPSVPPAGEALRRDERWTETTREDGKVAVRAREATIDAALEMTFPASDPPSWSP